MASLRGASHPGTDRPRVGRGEEFTGIFTMPFAVTVSAFGLVACPSLFSHFSEFSYLLTDESLMKPDNSRIPDCRSELLQDVSIELGRRLRGVRYVARGRKLQFRVYNLTIDDHEVEFFQAIRWEQQNSYIEITVGENHEATFVYRKPFPHKHARSEHIRFRASLAGLNAYAIAEIMRESLRCMSGVSAMLTYWRTIAVEG